MRAHTESEAIEVCDLVAEWQARFLLALGRRMVFAADEYYLLAGRPFPPASDYGDFSTSTEDGIGMARGFELEFGGEVVGAVGPQPGFFASVDGAPALGYRAPRSGEAHAVGVSIGPRRGAAIGVLTGAYGAAVLRPLIAGLGSRRCAHRGGRESLLRRQRRRRRVDGGEDVACTLSSQPPGDRYLLPDVCLSGGRFLDGSIPADLPRTVEVVSTDGVALRKALA